MIFGYLYIPDLKYYMYNGRKIITFNFLLKDNVCMHDDLNVTCMYTILRCNSLIKTVRGLFVET